MEQWRKVLGIVNVELKDSPKNFGADEKKVKISRDDVAARGGAAIVDHINKYVGVYGGPGGYRQSRIQNRLPELIVQDVVDKYIEFLARFDDDDNESLNNFVKYTTKKSKEPSFIESVYKVLLADITISFDYVIGVVGAAKGYFEFMIFGLVLSVVLTGALATYLANYIQKHIWIAYIGLGFILLIAIQLIIGGLADLEILEINKNFIKYF